MNLFSELSLILFTLANDSDKSYPYIYEGLSIPMEGQMKHMMVWVIVECTPVGQTKHIWLKM